MKPTNQQSARTFFRTGERECLLDGSRVGNLSFTPAHQKLIFFLFVSGLSKTPKTDDLGFNAASGTNMIGGDNGGTEKTLPTVANAGAGEGGASGARGSEVKRW